MPACPSHLGTEMGGRAGVALGRLEGHCSGRRGHSRPGAGLGWARPQRGTETPDTSSGAASSRPGSGKWGFGDGGVCLRGVTLPTSHPPAGLRKRWCQRHPSALPQQPWGRRGAPPSVDNHSHSRGRGSVPTEEDAPDESSESPQPVREARRGAQTSP